MPQFVFHLIYFYFFQVVERCGNYSFLIGLDLVTTYVKKYVSKHANKILRAFILHWCWHHKL